MTPIPTEYKHIVCTPGFYEGLPCSDNHKIAVHDIARCFNQGFTPEQIVQDHFMALTLAQVYSALAYYFDHREHIDREIGEQCAEISSHAQADNSPLAQRMRAAIVECKQQLGG